MQKINMLATPRNVSTALMYAFAQRMDTKVVDEPFYAYFLDRTGIVHPGRDEVLDYLPRTVEEIEAQWDEMEGDHEMLFLKNMAHHLPAYPLDNLLQYTNFFLIRDPVRQINSYLKIRETVEMIDLGLDRQWEMYSFLLENGVRAPVLDSGDLLKDPPHVLALLCDALDIPYDPAMESWDAGPIPEDGCWAKYWYSGVHKSTGFRQGKSPIPVLEDHLDLYRQCREIYDRFSEYAIMPGEHATDV